jgi:hypothetical protein
MRTSGIRKLMSSAVSDTNRGKSSVVVRRLGLDTQYEPDMVVVD